MRAAQNFSRDTTLLARLREAETALAAQKQRYDRILNDLVIKLKFLEDNKVSQPMVEISTKVLNADQGSQN